MTVEPMTIHGKAVVIRAAAGYEPTLEVDEAASRPLIESDSPLVLEGIGLQIRSASAGSGATGQARAGEDAVPTGMDRARLAGSPVGLALVRVAAEVARGFAMGHSATVSGVSTAIGLDEKASLEMLERLSKAGFLHEVPLGQGREGFTLARPAEKVRARELLELASQVSAGGRVSSEDGKLGELRRAQLDAAADLSLADLAGSSSSAGSAGGTEPGAGLAASS